MKSFIKSLKMVFALLLSAAPACAAPGGEVAGAFIQFNRANAAWPAERWGKIFDEMQDVKMNTVIIQWCAEEPILYFKDDDLPFKEQHDALERVMAAASGRNLSIFLGIQNDPAYWKEITARDKALRDYFLVRRAQNERLQAAMLKKFGQRPDWAGYYIPDEIDDLSWREKDRRGLFRQYLRETTAALRKYDDKRPIAISAFFRARTAPEVFTNMFFDLAGGIGLDYLLIQDGAGAGDPPLDVLPLYYRALFNEGSPPLPELWCVLEAFRQTSGQNEPFAAETAPAERVKQQIRMAAGFKRRIIFSFPDYVDPERGPAAKALFDTLPK